MQVSVIVPTVRPEQIFGCLESIHKAAEGLDSYEIVVAADFIDHAGHSNRNEKWLFRPDRLGPVNAICEAEKHCKGDYLFLISDEDRLHPGTLSLMYGHSEFQRARGTEIIVVPNCGMTFAQRGYYNVPFPPFPFVHRDIVKKLGGTLLDPKFGAHYADPDLGCRAYVNNVQLRFLSNVTLSHPNSVTESSHVANREKYFDQDEAYFRSKWDHLGEFVRH